MQLVAVDLRRKSFLGPAALVGAVCLLGVGVSSGRSIAIAAPLAVIAVIAAPVIRRAHIGWTSILTVMLAVIFFIPIKRYLLTSAFSSSDVLNQPTPIQPLHLTPSSPSSTSGTAAFDLEPYRVVVGLILLGWCGALLVDRRVRWRRTTLDAPLGLLVAAVLASELANASRVASLGSYVVKSLTFFLSFVLVFYLSASAIRTRRDIDRIVSALVGFGAVVAVFAMIESRTQFNVFDHLTRVIPFLRLRETGLISADQLARNGRLRVYASAQHPIALAAMFAVLLPISVFLARTRSRRWWVASVLLFLGILATGSRTGILMLLAIGLVYLWLRPRATLRLWPALFPAVVLIHIALPGTIGGLQSAFFPSGGLIKQQDNIVRGNELRSNGRVADIGPALRELGSDPLAGLGFGTRITAGPDLNAAVLDDGWLGLTLETGLAGLFAWLWIFVRSIRRLARAARDDSSERGWLLVALAAGITAFAVGMLTYDAFSFIQVTFVLFVLLGISSAIVASPKVAIVSEPAPTTG